jgi:hypothetical protein
MVTDGVCFDARKFQGFMPEPLSYNRRVFAKAFQETASFTQRKLSVSAFMAVIVRVAFWRFAQTQATWNGVWAEVWRDLLIIVGSYTTVILGSFVVNLFRAPGLLDAECQQQISHLTSELDLPDKAKANHIRGLLAQVSEDAKKILRLAMHYEAIEIRHIKIEGLSWDDIQKALQECVSATLLRVEHESIDTSSMLAYAKMRVFYQVPQEFRETLKRLLYTTPALSSSFNSQT